MGLHPSDLLPLQPELCISLVVVPRWRRRYWLDEIGLRWEMAGICWRLYPEVLPAGPAPQTAPWMSV